MTQIRIACLDMAGTTVADDGGVMSAFSAAIADAVLTAGAPGYDDAFRIVHDTMGQSKIDVFRRILGGEAQAQRANLVFEERYAESVRAGLVAPITIWRWWVTRPVTWNQACARAPGWWPACSVAPAAGTSWSRRRSAHPDGYHGAAGAARSGVTGRPVARLAGSQHGVTVSRGAR